MKILILIFLMSFSILIKGQNIKFATSQSDGVNDKIHFFDSLGKLRDSIVINDQNPWNKLTYKKIGKDRYGNNTYLINKTELEELFNNELNNNIINKLALKENEVFSLSSTAVISENSSKFIAISYGLFCEVENSDEIVSAKSHVVIYDQNKDLLYSSDLFTFVNGSIAISDNPRYIAYRTGINWADGEIKPIGFEIFDLVKEKVVYESTGIFNLVEYLPTLNIIRASLSVENDMNLDIYFDTVSNVIYVYKYISSIDETLIDITPEGLIYMTSKGSKVIKFNNMKNIRLL